MNVADVIDKCRRAALWRRAGLGIQYKLGEGAYNPDMDHPGTLTNNGEYASDCIGFVMHCLELPRRRTGFNQGGSVVGWINTDSTCEDGLGIKDRLVTARQELFAPLRYPKLGALVVFKSLFGPRLERLRPGHIGIVSAVPEAFDPRNELSWRMLKVWHCSNSNKGLTAIAETSGLIFRESVLKRGGFLWPRHVTP